MHQTHIQSSNVSGNLSSMNVSAQCAAFVPCHMVLTAVLQAALATVQAYPYTVDVPALAEAAALELGEPPAPALLSGSG